MFVGEGEKNVKAVFSLAKKLSADRPCVVFIDEVKFIILALLLNISSMLRAERQLF
jgi:ATP-dependent 26S proteasome regulatory subunit